MTATLATKENTTSPATPAVLRQWLLPMPRSTCWRAQTRGAWKAISRSNPSTLHSSQEPGVPSQVPWAWPLPRSDYFPSVVKSTSRNARTSRASPAGTKLPEMTDAGVSPLEQGTASPLVAVALVGFMGAGKTTVGRALAQRTGWRFEDLDELIEKSQGQTIAEIFEASGEARFRDLERLL